MITKRDYAVLSFLKEFKAASTSTIASLFYPSPSVARTRLSALYTLGEVKRERGSVSLQYVWYIKRPGNLRHTVTVSDFAAKYAKQHKIISMTREPDLGGVRPDLQINHLDNGKERVALVEVELSNKGLDTEKYRRWEAVEMPRLFRERPHRIVVTDKAFIKPSKEFELVRI